MNGRSSRHGWRLPRLLYERFRHSQHELAAAKRERYTHTPADPFGAFRDFVFSQIRSGDVILDVGCGDGSCFGDLREKVDVKVIGIDISPSELARNEEVDEKLAVDATETLGVPRESASVVFTQMFLEHIRRPEQFHHLTFEALRPGGRIFHLLPNGLYPVFLFNRMLPFSVSRRLATLSANDRPREAVFKAYYRLCTPHRLARMLRRVGYERLEMRFFGNYSYGSAFYPLFWSLYAYERGLEWLGCKWLWPYVLVTATRP